MNSIKIINQKLSIKEFNGQRVITFKDIDRVHNRPMNTASRNFRANKKHFIENVDYYDVTVGKYKSDEIRRAGFNNPRGGYLFTESGYLMLVKSFTDDLAWEVQRQLINAYFKSKETSLKVKGEPKKSNKIEIYEYMRLAEDLSTLAYNRAKGSKYYDRLISIILDIYNDIELVPKKLKSIDINNIDGWMLLSAKMEFKKSLKTIMQYY